MKLFFPAFCVAAASTLYATTIPIDPGPQGRVHGAETIPFTALDGTPLNGQAISLDYVFSGDKFLRMLPSTNKSFIFAVILDTSATGFLPWPTGSGFLTAANGDNLGGVFAGGGSSSSIDPTEQLDASVALFPLFLDNSGTPRLVTDHFDFSGAHFDLTMPNVQGAEVLDGRLLLLPNAIRPWTNVWVIGPHVPETGSTLALLAIGSLGLWAWDVRCHCRHRGHL